MSINNYNLKFSIVKLAKPYSREAKSCELCLQEKTFILFSDHYETLNRRSEILYKCVHRAGHLLDKWWSFLSWLKRSPLWIICGKKFQKCLWKIIKWLWENILSGKIFCEYVEKLFEVILVKSRIPMTSNDRNTVYILILNWYLNKIVLPIYNIPFHNIVSLSCTKYTTIFFALLASQLEARSQV